MKNASWWSQPVAAEGSIASEGIRRQLGKPQLDPLTVLVRETAQNTCDAIVPGHDEADFAVRINDLSGDRLEAWRDFLLPEPSGSNLGLEQSMSRASTLLSIADRRTTGLGGPLRADELPVPGERSDFVNFVRNVGERKAVDLSGGSYGFGKGILYGVSRCHVVVADSVCVYRGARQRRLIGVALGDGYTHRSTRWTGRHWLGLHEDDHTRPLLDEEAEDAALRLGLPPFRDDDTGTTIVVVDADLGRHGDGGESERPRTADEAATYVVSSMLWNLWPRLISKRTGRLNCSVKRDGFTFAVPDPEKTIELAPFVKAYRAVTEGGDYEVPPRKAKPSEVGRLAIREGMAAPRPNRELLVAAPFTGRAHHCARMRQADLVVDYESGEPLAEESLQYGGVFRSSPEADGFFSEAEPPTHDTWVLNGLRGTARGVVQLATSFVRGRMSARPTATVTGDAGSASLAPLAGRLAGLMATDGDQATAAGDGPTRVPSRGRRSTAGPRFVHGPVLVRENSRPVVRARVRFPQWPTIRSVTIRPSVVLDSGTETPSPKAVHIEGWRCTETGRTVEGDTLDVDRRSAREWELRVQPLQDAVLRIDLDVEGS